MYLYPFFVSNAAMVFGSKVLIQEVEKIPQKKYKKIQQLKCEKNAKKVLKKCSNEKFLKNVPKNAQKSTQRCGSKICKDCVDC